MAEKLETQRGQAVSAMANSIVEYINGYVGIVPYGNNLALSAGSGQLILQTGVYIVNGKKAIINEPVVIAFPSETTGTVNYYVSLLFNMENLGTVSVITYPVASANLTQYKYSDDLFIKDDVGKRVEILYMVTNTTSGVSKIQKACPNVTSSNAYSLGLVNTLSTTVTNGFNDVNNEFVVVNNKVNTLNTTVTNGFNNVNSELVVINNRLSKVERNYDILWTGSLSPGGAVAFKSGFDARDYSSFEVIFGGYESANIDNTYRYNSDRTLHGFGGSPHLDTTGFNQVTFAASVSLYNTFIGLTYLKGEYLIHYASGNHSAGGASSITAVVGIR